MEVKNIIRNIIRKNINNLFENVQMADKEYFNPGKLSQKAKEIVLKITGGDNFTKIISDIYFAKFQQSIEQSKWIFPPVSGEEEDTVKNDILHIDTLKEIKQLYNDLKSYNKNVFPITGLDVYKPGDIWNIISGLRQRRLILELFKKLPSIAVRNMKMDIRQERTYPELQRYRSDLEHFLGYFSLLGNRDVELQQNILKKMFKSNITLDQISDFVEEKENLLGGEDFTREKIKELSKSEDFEVIYETPTSMIVRVDSPQGIKAIGCNSLWCFTYGNGFDNAYRQWNNYSHNDTVYVVVDFREKSDSQDFMHVLIKPLVNENGRFYKYTVDNEDQIPLYNMANTNYSDPYLVLTHILGPDYKKLVKKYMNFEY